MTQTTDLLPASIVERALTHMEKGVEAIEAVKLAIEEENNLCWLAGYGIDMKTGRVERELQKEILQYMCSKVYNRINNTSF